LKRDGVRTVPASLPEHERFLTADQLAPILGVSLDWVYERAKSGELPSFKIGTQRRFLYSEVRQALERFREGPQAARLRSA
jgi:excisionase family DNA binding protein